MISAKLVHHIEDHWEQVSGRFYRLLRSSQEVPYIARLPESELNETCRRILRNLGNWLVSGSESEIAWYYEKIGADRHRQAMPLCEAIRALQFMKDSTISFIQDESSIETSVDLYAEEELENQLGRFFDLLIFHLARGYENAAAAAHAKALRAAAGPG
jgi:hypothetical protein